MLQITEQLQKLSEELCELVMGVGESGVELLLEETQSLESLLSLEEGDLKDLEYDNGRRAFSDEAANTFLHLMGVLDDELNVEENLVMLLTLKFIDRNISGVRERETVEDLNINPFIVREFNLRNPEEIIKFFLYQSASRGVVTSMGDKFEKLAKVFHLEDTEREGFDGELTRDGTRYFVQVKSGPDTLNKDMLEYLAEKMGDAEEEYPGCETLLGLCYGKEEQVSDKIRNYLPGEGLERVKIGKEFWDFIADEDDHYITLLKAIRQASEGYPRFFRLLREEGERITSDYRKDLGEEFGGNSLVEIIEDRTDQMIRNWEEEYGSLSPKTVDEMIRDHM